MDSLRIVFVLLAAGCTQPPAELMVSVRSGDSYINLVVDGELTNQVVPSGYIRFIGDDCATGSCDTELVDLVLRDGSFSLVATQSIDASWRDGSLILAPGALHATMLVQGDSHHVANVDPLNASIDRNRVGFESFVTFADSAGNQAYVVLVGDVGYVTQRTCQPKDVLYEICTTTRRLVPRTRVSSAVRRRDLSLLTGASFDAFRHPRSIIKWRKGENGEPINRGYVHPIGRGL